ncbi:hypothetical protein H0X10_03605 [Candidatus Saccharibacteria bacterium]|nr:hypothetical protein [Candidatus Saccharibacteria bacterium]
MFGQNNDNQDPQTIQNNMAGPGSENNPPAGFFNPSAPNPPQQPFGTNDNNGQVIADVSAPVLADPNPTDFTAPSTPADGPAPVNTMPPPPDASITPSNDHLLSMKQEALQHLNPLVSHLDQGPEEKFRTVMMMIQASDDHNKLGEAFDLAKQITDDKTRAQALLDVINEINYFTQQHSN